MATAEANFPDKGYETPMTVTLHLTGEEAELLMKLAYTGITGGSRVRLVLSDNIGEALADAGVQYRHLGSFKQNINVDHNIGD